MTKEMLINVSEGEECRIALLEDGKLEELYMERTSSTSHVGNIYKGRVTNVEASIQAAFIDFGLGRNGFLHISDLMPTYFGRRGDEIVETVGKKMARRDRPPIQRCLRRGDEIVVQIIKEGIGTKGPTLSTYLSIPGRFLVMMPGMGKMGVSRKIEDDVERRRLRQILDQLEPPEDVGFIIRTAGVGRSKMEIERDLKYLVRLWDNLKKKRDGGPGPVELYTEGDLVTRTVRDMFSTDVDTIIVDNKEVAKRVKEVIKLSNPRARNKVELYEDPIPLFHKFGIEREIELMYSRHVPLPSGGSLVIDSTEAIVAIDVNSGKFRDHSDAETTAFKTDMEAAEEIPRQLRLRDLGGVIICDFIDLRFERHRRELEKKLHDNFRKDRAKSKILRMSQFGIIEMTRQRMRPSLKRSIYFDCPHCKGAGLVKTPESMSLDVMRRLAIAINDQRVVRVELTVCAEVSYYLQNRKRGTLGDLERQYDKRIVIHSDPHSGLDEMKLELFDARDGLVVVEELEQALRPHPHRTQLTTRSHGSQQQPSRNDRRQRIEQTRRPPQGVRGQQDDWRRREEAIDDDSEDFDRDEAVDELDSRGGDDDRSEHRDRPPTPNREAEAPDDEPGDFADEESPEIEARDDDDESGDRDERGGERDRRPAPQGRNDRRDFSGRRDEPRREFPRRDEPQRNDSRRNDSRQGAQGGQGGQPRRDDRNNQQQDRNRQPQNQPRNDRGGFDPNRPRFDPRQQGPVRAVAGQDRGPQNGQDGQVGPPNGETQEEGGRRRRRRRRRRGRGRGGQQGQPIEGGQGDPSLQGERDDDAESGYDEGLPPEGERQDEEREGVFEAGGEEIFEYERGEDENRSKLEDRHDEPLDEREERVERYVEEPRIEADASGRILNERMQRTAYEESETVETAAEAPAGGEPPAGAESPEAAPAEPADEKPKRRRRGSAAAAAPKAPRKTAAKTGTRPPRRKRGAAADAESAPAAPEAEASTTEAPPASPASQETAEEPPRRGRPRSTDRHLMPEEEPDEPLRPSSASRRPRSSRDLDDIPEDLF